MARSTTHIIVLAAGRGMRLGTRTDEIPKWLVPIRGTTVASRQVAAIKSALDVDPDLDLTFNVVTGHARGAIESFAAGVDRPPLRTLYNEEYLRLNNWYSLLVGLRAVAAGSDARVLVLNSDLLTPAGWTVRFLLESAHTDEESLIAVDCIRPLTDEAMKVGVRPAPNGESVEIRHIAKVGVEEPVGESIGMIMVRGSVLDRWQAALESFVGRAELANVWYESAMMQTVEDGAHWIVWPTPDSRWVEIDDEADYSAALELVEGGDRGHDA